MTSKKNSPKKNCGSIHLRDGRTLAWAAAVAACLAHVLDVLGLVRTGVRIDCGIQSPQKNRQQPATSNQ